MFARGSLNGEKEAENKSGSKGGRGSTHHGSGTRGYVLLEAICAVGRTIASLAGQGGYGNRKTIAKKLRTAIDELGRHYGMWTTTTGRRPTQSVVYV